jgi:regulatory protein
LEKLRLDGVEEAYCASAHAHANEQGVEVALRFAERRRIGPFSSLAADSHQRQKWIGAMVRAGHSFALARAISALDPGAEIDIAMLCEYADMLEH